MPLEPDINLTSSPPGQGNPTLVDQEVVDQLRQDIIQHFEQLKLPALNGDKTNGVLSKDAIRCSHAHQREEIFQREYKAIHKYIPHLLPHFANGNEVHPERIDPVLIPVDSKDDTGRLFRFAALLWTVPVSQGYGRRLRFLVMDRSNQKLIGLIALGDPVFNLKCRDEWIGWDQADRRARLVNVMDAFVVGAIPPYNFLLGGKLVTALIGSAEVSEAFLHRYNQTTGIISNTNKSAKLALVTVTSALGRSSIYNRVHLKDSNGETLVKLQKIGETQGYGHFQFSNELFERLRRLLQEENHTYANGHQFGQGPNWRFRVTRVGLKRLGLEEDLVHHGIQREVFAMPMVPEFKEYLRGTTSDINLIRPSAAEISTAALHRWIVPRSTRQPDFHMFKINQMLENLGLEVPSVVRPTKSPRSSQLAFKDF